MSENAFGGPTTEERVAKVRDEFARVAFARLLGIELGEVGHGAATVHLPVRDELKQNLGVVHGGVIAALLDTAAALAIITLLEPGEASTTIDLTVQYLRPITEGFVSAHGRVRRAGRRVISVTIDLVDASGSLVATALTTYLRFEDRRER